MKKLPDTEFDVMKVVWDNTPPVTTTMIMEQLGIFIAICTVGIIVVGYFFNAIQYLIV